jgi:hypothetical protein
MKSQTQFPFGQTLLYLGVIRYRPKNIRQEKTIQQEKSPDPIGFEKSADLFGQIHPGKKHSPWQGNTIGQGDQPA